MSKKIGQEITSTQDFEIELTLSGNKLLVKEGDKGFVDSKGNVHYTTGQARGKIQCLTNVELKGYDHENIAKMIFKRIKNEFGLSEYLEDYEISEKDLVNEIEDILSDIL